MAQPRAFSCPVEAALSVIGGRWKILVICRLFEGKQRFNEMRRSIGGVSQRMLTQSLRELERDGIVKRRVFPDSPPHVEYALTAFGRSLEPVLDRLCEWGETYQLRGTPLPPLDVEPAVVVSRSTAAGAVSRTRARPPPRS